MLEGKIPKILLHAAASFRVGVDIDYIVQLWVLASGIVPVTYVDI